MNIFKSINKKEFGRYLIFQILLFIVYSLTNSLVLSFALADMQQAMLTGITNNHNRAISILLSFVILIIFFFVSYFVLKIFVFKHPVRFVPMEALKMLSRNLLTGFFVIVTGSIIGFITGFIAGILGFKLLLYTLIIISIILFLPFVFVLHYLMMRRVFVS